MSAVAQRLDRLPPSRYLRDLVTRISLGGWFEFYDLFMNAYIALGMIRERLYAATGAGVGAFASFVAAGFLGMFVGTFVFGWVSDRFGRRTTFVWSLVFYSLMTLIMAFGQSALVIDVFRFLAGIGIGVQIITIDAYVSEISPAAARGRFIAYSQFVTYTAVPAVALLSTLLVPQVIAGLAGWRWVALIGALGAVFVWPIQRGLPESPRWYESHRRPHDAECIVREIERAAGVAHPAPAQLRHVRQPERDVQRDARWSEIWRGQYRDRTVMLVVFNFFQTVGYYGFAAWVPLLLNQEGVTFVRSLDYTAVIALVNPFGPIIAMQFADVIERKWQIVTSAAAVAGLSLLFSHARAAFAIIGAGVLYTLAINWFSSAFHTYQAELYPTRVRAQAVGFVYSWSRFSGALAALLTGSILRAFGAGGVFVFIAAAMVITAAVVAGLGPPATRRALEAVSP